jgi:hypothetical protein
MCFTCVIDQLKAHGVILSDDDQMKVDKMLSDFGRINNQMSQTRDVNEWTELQILCNMISKELDRTFNILCDLLDIMPILPAEMRIQGFVNLSTMETFVVRTRALFERVRAEMRRNRMQPFDVAMAAPAA